MNYTRSGVVTVAATPCQQPAGPDFGFPDTGLYVAHRQVMIWIRMRLEPATRVLAIVVLSLGLIGCDAITSALDTTEPASPTTSPPASTEPAPTSSTAPEVTAAPDTTVAPEPTSPPASEPPVDQGAGDGDWLLPLIGLLLLGVLLVGILIGRARRREQPTVVPVADGKGFKDYVRDGYSEARWLLDAFSDELAIWRGNALFEGRTDLEASAGTTFASSWGQLDERMDRAGSDLYRAEAAAPDQNTAEMIRATIGALQSARLALDARAEARFATRRAEAQLELAQAGERERLASSNLAETRQRLSDALLSLSAVI